ncbi:DUF3180 domain-containing protein [Bailinhaonella thermotolerans]|uniref:DUF3180 domain-containing protein n=1 Tax=Bailinhaonella thermotolerans TaxID=1070861 RepID=A0A3A4A2L8_9ACTN|nr:DUF3180 domain-containing protein [Bailinhaonella thermotolerans]RJL22570.1 DUF3180 domain-containing protein [Bailinhaonella thermotolerans]
MKPTRPALLVAVVVVCALLVWVPLRGAYSDLPTLPWTAAPSLLLLALGEAYTGWLTRGRIQRKEGTKPVEPLTVARLAALAKASAYAGAVLAGVFAGFALHVLPMLDQETPARDALVAGGSFIAAVALVGAALFLEYCCRVPKDGSGRDEPPPEPPPVHHP